MPWRRHFALFVDFVAALFRPAAAGAFSSAPDANAQARVGTFELVAVTLVGTSTETSPGLHEGIGRAYDENASGYRFAAGGAGRAAPELSTAAQRSIRSLEGRLAEHESKLAAYRENPFAFDNRGDLARNAARPEVQQRIIDGRIRHLEGEIRNFQHQLERLRSGSVEP